MHGKTTLSLIHDAVGSEKFTVLAATIDNLKAELENLRNKATIDDEIETLEIAPLADRFGISEKAFRDQVDRAIGAGHVVKVGKRWVIRKRRFLEFLTRNEPLGMTSPPRAGR
jgi:hypothetical protein